MIEFYFFTYRHEIAALLVNTGIVHKHKVKRTITEVASQLFLIVK